MNHETAALPVVLIVDDDAQTRLLVTETLEPDGFSIEEAASGNAGLDAFQRVRPALVLLDVTMPGMSGFRIRPAFRLTITTTRRETTPGASKGGPITRKACTRVRVLD